MKYDKTGLIVIDMQADYIGIKSEDRFIKTREKLLKANVQIVECSE